MTCQRQTDGFAVGINASDYFITFTKFVSLETNIIVTLHGTSRGKRTVVCRYVRMKENQFNETTININININEKLSA